MNFRRTLLSRWEWVYVLSLLLPFFIYSLSLRVAGVYSVSGLASTSDPVLSEISFGFGYALFVIGVIAVTRPGPLRWVALVLCHGVTMFLVIFNALAYLNLQEKGEALDYGTVAAWFSGNHVLPASFLEVGRDPAIRGLLLGALLCAVVGPPIITLAVKRRWKRLRKPPGATPRGGFAAGSLGLLLLAIGLVSISLLTDEVATDREPPASIDLAGGEQASVEETGEADESIAGTEEPKAGPVTNFSAADAVLKTTSRTERRNVVLIHLESTRAQSATPYNQDLKTMPFLDELSGGSLITERTHVIVPRSSKGSTAINCGIEPALSPGPEYHPGGIPARCLASLLKQQGYRTVWFQSLSEAAGDYWDGVLSENYGYDEFYPAEAMNREGFQVTNSFGYEEDIMLGPSEEWLRNRDEPFLAQYFTGTGHYGYDCLPNRYGYEPFSDDEQLDRYHNCLRLLDRFLENLFDQYRRLGLYENTVFVLYGDHGEGFMEHGRYMHGDNPYQEGLHVPLLIHVPGWFEGGEQARGLSSQIDVLPTVLEILGFEVQNGVYPGYSLLQPLPEDRILRSSCIRPYRCVASLQGTEKYIYHYGDYPDELYDLAEDPLEKHNLASDRGEEELALRREDLLAWAAKNDAEYADLAARQP